MALVLLLPSLLAAQAEGESKYLLFDVIPHEQLNKQRRAYMFYLDLAMRLKRTLVLPRARLVKKDAAGRFLDAQAEYARWGELFNVSLLNELHPVIELQEFLDQGNEVSLMMKIDHKGCEGGGRGTIDFNGIGGVRVARHECAAGMQYNPAGLFKLKDLPSIGFYNTVDQMSPQQALPLRKHVRYENGVYDAASAFVQANFGKQPFVALHWRQTDFLQVRRTQPGVLQSARDLVSHARVLMARAGTEQVYLATDCDDQRDLEYVRANLNPVMYPPSRTVRSLRARTDVANVEIVICAMAKEFLGTKTSSFTLAINEERVAIFGRLPSSGSEMDALPSSPPPSKTPNAFPGTPARVPSRGSDDLNVPPQRRSKGPASPPYASPVARISELQRYLLFDVIPHEQLNKQRRAYMFYLDLAMRLKRILVLPRARLVKKDAAGRFLDAQAEYVRWGELFNVSLLNELHPVIELQDFLAQGNEVSSLIQIDSQAIHGSR